MAIPRRGLTGGTEGKALLPFKSILRQASDVLQTPLTDPLIKAGVVSPGAQGSAAFPQTTGVEGAKLAAGDPTEDEAAIAQASDIPKTPPIQAGVVSPGARGSAAFPQTTGVGEVNQAAGDPIEDEAASAQAGAAAMELVDTAAANASAEATAAQAIAAMENVQVQLTQVQKQASPELPLDSLAKEVQPEPTAKEKAPAPAVDMAALVAALRTIQHGMEQTMQDAVSALQTNVQPQLTEQQRSAQAGLQSMEERVTREQRTVFAKVGAKTASMGMGLQELANNAHESHLVVQDLQRKMEEQEQRVGTMNTAISTMVPTGGAKPATAASLPAAAGPPAELPLPALPGPAARKDGPRSSAEQAKRGEYLQPAVQNKPDGGGCLLAPCRCAPQAVPMLPRHFHIRRSDLRPPHETPRAPDNTTNAGRSTRVPVGRWVRPGAGHRLGATGA
jgi:hypothetical protein